MSTNDPTTSKPVEHREHPDFPGYQVGSDGGVWQPAVEYRDIPGFPGYRVGDDGSVWSCLVWGHAGFTGKWHEMKGFCDRGYKQVNLSKDSILYIRRVHRLVLEAFVGPCPDGMECCHYNGKRDDNRLENLRWDTPSANKRDSIRHGTHVLVHKIGSECSLAKLTEDDIPKIRELLDRGVPQRKIAAQFGVVQHTIQCIKFGETWTHVK